MKRYIFFAVILLSPVVALSQEGYQIPITVKPFTNAYVYLGYYYGKMKALADSAFLDANSTGVFKGKKPLEGGIYFIVSPKKEILFEVLIDKEQSFSIKADTSGLPFRVEFTGSKENTRFKEYSAFATETGRAIQANNQQLSLKKSPRDSAILSKKLLSLSEKMQQFRDSISRSNPESLLSALFMAMREPQVPPAEKHPGGKYDTNYAFRYFKSHYWDGVSFYDDRLVRTPFFEPKLEKYYKDLVLPHPDSIIVEVDQMLLEARSAPEMYKFLMVHFVQKYINPQYMGQDAVFVHLFEKYINTGKAEFFTAAYRDHVSKRAYSLMANLIGQPAADMEMVDTLGRPLPLYKVNATYTIVCFWDPSCGHCKEVVPKVDSIYQAKWKKQGVKVYGVMVDGKKDDWQKFIHEYKLTDWIHVHQLPGQAEKESAAGKPGYKQLYDVYQTPVLYLLDKNKNIVAKKLTYLQIDEVINLKSSNTISN